MNKGFYLKLALSNLRRSRKFYAPYLLASVVTVSMCYIILALNAGHMLDGMRGEMIMRSYMALGGVVVLIFAAIFLFYTNSFLTRRRRQEFGLYSILGMEKRHIARLLSVETLMLFAASLGLGLGLGALLSKLVGLGALKLIQADAVFGFEFVPGAAKLTAVAFGAIFALILLFEGVQLRRATAIDLMKSREQGEREPKTKALMALLGAIAMGGGYYITIVTENPIKATMLFFVAVILVIIGTYLLFTAGSIAVLKALRKNKKYYYRPNHFISVSGMIYRMKQNAAGLASICILSTMVLVMLSATISLTIGSEDVIAKQYPHEMQYASMDGDWPNFWETVDEALRPLGVEPDNAVEYDLLTLAAAKEGGELVLTPDDRMSPAYVRVLKYDDYAAMAGADALPRPGQDEALIVQGEWPEDALTVGGWTLRIAGRADGFSGANDGMLYAADMYVLVLPDGAALQRMDGIQREAYGDHASELRRWYAFDIPLTGDALERATTDVEAAIARAGLPGGGYIASGARWEGREDQYALSGGLMFLGVFLGILFVMATVLMMYYKQISEGYEDRTRFEIMQKVGLDDREIQRSIRSQVLTVFFLPLVVACIHTGGAFFIVRRVMMLFSLNNGPLMLKCTLGTMGVFAAFYAATYAVTANVYYRIVARSAQ